MTATGAAIQDLYDAGARLFLVLNLPDLGDTPAARAAGVEAAATFVTQFYNGALETALAGLELLNDNIVIVPFDVFDGFNELVANPGLAGLTNVIDSCITPDVFVGAICQHPRDYLFWDFIHPTKTAHAYLAEQVQMVVEDNFFVAAPVFAQAP